MSIYEDGIPTLLDDIHSIPTRLERINSLEWPKAVAGSGNADVTVAERHLQDFLVRCPTILPLQHFSSTFHPSICIGREVSTGAGSIDCLFISGQGRLTIVETKLHKNPEARRAVVAQLLEYCDQVSRFSYEILDKCARKFSKEWYPHHDYSDLHSFVRWSLKQSQKTTEDEREGEWTLDDNQFYRQTSSSLRRGEMLGLIVGDRIDKRIISLAEFAKSKPGLALEIGLVELAFYRPTGQKSPLIVVPSVLEQATPITRTVVDVRVDSSGAVHVNVEPVSEVPSVTSGGRPPQLASNLQFLELVKQLVPAAEERMKILLAKMQSIAENSNGLFELDYGGATANLYWITKDWITKDDKKLRFFELGARAGRATVSVWLVYIRNAGYGQLEAKLYDVASLRIPIIRGKPSSSVDVLNTDIDTMVALIESLSDSISTEAGSMGE